MSFLIGVDVGGTNIVCGLINSEGTLIRKSKRSTEQHKGSVAVVSKITDMIKDLLHEENQGLEALVAVGIGTPGFVDPEQGVSLFSANLHWENVPLAKMVSEQVACPVFVNNDVRMYVYGEAMVGAGQGHQHVLGITLGTGIAMALVNDGTLYYGGGYLAGEIGHIPMEGITEACNCGQTGCLETIVSAPGMARQARQAIAEGKQSILTEWFSDTSEITSSDLSKAYDLNDELAIELMQVTGKMLGRGLSFAIPLLSPDVIIIGGGVAQSGERLFAPMREEIQRQIHPMYWERLHIKTAQHLDDAGVIGSAMYAKSRILT